MNTSSASGPSTIRSLRRDISSADDLQIARIVAQIDALGNRGPADALIEPLRPRLRALRLPRPLRLVRLMFHPLNPLIVPAPRWQPGTNTIPRSALMPMFDQVRTAMGNTAQQIEAEIGGRTTDDTLLIRRIGQSIWPEAARIIGELNVPESWDSTGLTTASYRPLAECVALLLEMAVPLEVLCEEAARDLLSPAPDRFSFLLARAGARNNSHLAMFTTLLLARLPQAGAILREVGSKKEAAAISAALEQAEDLLLDQLGADQGIEGQLGSVTLMEAGTAAARIASLLKQIDAGSRKAPRREQVRALRQRLDACCKERFMFALHEDLLTPLQTPDLGDNPGAPRPLEAAARGLRILETEARGIGSAATYDLLLQKATEAVCSPTMRQRLTKVDQVRLIEILSGADAAEAFLDRPD